MIETERLLLRKPRLEDAPALVALYSDPEAMRFIGGVHDGPQDLEFVVGRWLERWERNGGFGQFVAERRDDGAVLGRVGLVVWDTSIWAITSMTEAGGMPSPSSAGRSPEPTGEPDTRRKARGRCATGSIPSSGSDASSR